MDKDHWRLPPQMPPYIELPVLRSEFCSQEMTDRALRYLWDNAEEFVKDQAYNEPGDFGYYYISNSKGIIEFFEEVASKEIEIPKTFIGMQDLLWELSRRIRKGTNLPEWPLVGKPLAPSISGPWPAIPSIPIIHVSEGGKPTGLTQEIADSVIEQVYQAIPELFFVRVESMRRADIGPPKLYKPFEREIEQRLAPSDNIQLIRRCINGEITRRLDQLCDIRRYT